MGGLLYLYILKLFIANLFLASESATLTSASSSMTASAAKIVVAVRQKNSALNISTGTTVTFAQLPDGLDFIQSVTFVWILTRMNIQIYLCQENYTNEYPKIFV